MCKQKEATVHLTKIAGEKMQKVDLCEECAKEKGVHDQSGFSFQDLFLGLGAPQETEEAAVGAELKCPMCGFSQADFKKAGRLGCAQCYDTFSEGLEGLLKSMHKGTRHKGKVPAALRSSQDLRERLGQLQKRLEKAVAEENFEQAAQVRDEIKVTKAKLAETTA